MRSLQIYNIYNLNVLITGSNRQDCSPIPQVFEVPATCRYRTHQPSAQAGVFAQVRCGMYYLKSTCIFSIIIVKKQSSHGHNS